MQPTGQGLTVDGATDPSGNEGAPLPPRPVRAAANDASRVEGVCGAPDNAGAGDTEMKGTEPWR